MGENFENENIRETLLQLENDYLCKICNGILIGAKGIGCGHVFCSYCLDLFLPIAISCPNPNCASKTFIKSSSVSLPHIDKEVSSLLRKLPLSFQNKFQSRKNERSEKAVERNGKMWNLREQLGEQERNSEFSETTNNRGIFDNLTSFDDICTSLLKSHLPSPIQIVDKQQPSFLPEIIKRLSNNSFTTARKPRSRQFTTNKSQDNAPRVVEEVAAFELFELYDKFFQVTENIENVEKLNEAGDVQEEIINENNNDTENANMELALFEELKKKHKSEIDALLQEVQTAVELDNFVTKWTKEIASNLTASDRSTEPFEELTSCQLINSMGHLKPSLSLENLEETAYDLELGAFISDGEEVFIPSSTKNSNNISVGEKEIKTISNKIEVMHFTSEKFVEDTLSFCKKIDKYKAALRKMNKNGSGLNTLNIAEIRKCNTARRLSPVRSKTIANIPNTSRSRPSRQPTPISNIEYRNMLPPTKSKRFVNNPTTKLSQLSLPSLFPSKRNIQR